MEEKEFKRGEIMITIKTEALGDILKDAMERRVGISICRRGGEWSKEYCEIDEVKDVRTNNGPMTVIILHPNDGSHVRLLDVQLITAVKFTSELTVMGTLTGEVKVESGNRIPHHVFEYF
jgi:hypothetical protein